MKIRRILSLFLCCGLLLPLLLTSVAGANSFSPRAQYLYLANLDTGDVLYTKDADVETDPAELTKIMTALLIVEAIEKEEISPDQLFTCNATARSGLGNKLSTQNIRVGEQMSVKDLLYCLLLPSCNEAANILAEGLCGTTKEFISLMNQRAAELGCTHTNFANATGLYHIKQHSTAHDLYLITAQAMKYALFRTVVATTDYRTTATATARSRYFYNSNGLLSAFTYLGYVYKPCIGAKDSVAEDGTCSIAAVATKKDTTLCAIVLGATNIRDESGKLKDRVVFSDASNLLEYGFTSFAVQTVLTAKDPLTQVDVIWSQEAQQILVHPAEDFSANLPKNLQEGDIEKQIVLHQNPLQAPIEAGETLGEVILLYQGKELGRVPLLAVSSAPLSQWLKLRSQIVDFFSNWSPQLLLLVLLVAVVLLALILVLVLRRPRRRRNQYRYRGSNYRGRRRR